MAPFDIIIAGGTAATATDVMEADIGIRDGRIAALGRDLGPAKHVIDASGKLVLPGGVDSHAHIEQLSAAGLMNADTFESATRAAALGARRRSSPSRRSIRACVSGRWSTTIWRSRAVARSSTAVST